MEAPNRDRPAALPRQTVTISTTIVRHQRNDVRSVWAIRPANLFTFQTNSRRVEYKIWGICVSRRARQTQLASQLCDEPERTGPPCGRSSFFVQLMRRPFAVCRKRRPLRSFTCSFAALREMLLAVAHTVPCERHGAVAALPFLNVPVLVGNSGGAVGLTWRKRKKRDWILNGSARLLEFGFGIGYGVGRRAI